MSKLYQRIPWRSITFLGLGYGLGRYIKNLDVVVTVGPPPYPLAPGEFPRLPDFNRLGQRAVHPSPHLDLEGLQRLADTIPEDIAVLFGVFSVADLEQGANGPDIAEVAAYLRRRGVQLHEWRQRFTDDAGRDVGEIAVAVGASVTDLELCHRRFADLKKDKSEPPKRVRDPPGRADGQS
jgi:hypothetical protein